MSYSLIITETAERNAMEVALYYEQQQRGLGVRFLSELEHAYIKIADHPHYYGYIAAQDIYRDIAIYKFPYVVVFQVHNNEVIVVDVFNTSRKPFM